MVIIPAQTGAKTSDRVSVSGNMIPFTFAANNLTIGESVTIQFSADDGATFEDLVLQGSTITLSTLNKMKTIVGPGIYRVVKGVTLNPVGVAAYYRVEGTAVVTP